MSDRDLIQALHIQLEEMEARLRVAEHRIHILTQGLEQIPSYFPALHDFVTNLLIKAKILEEQS